jgi:hypothetical protein
MNKSLLPSPFGVNTFGTRTQEGSSFTLITSVNELVQPFASVTVRTALNVPVEVYVWLGLVPVPVVLSPKSQDQEIAFGELVLVKLTVNAAYPLVLSAVKPAVTVFTCNVYVL